MYEHVKPCSECGGTPHRPIYHPEYKKKYDYEWKELDRLCDVRASICEWIEVLKGYEKGEPQV
jgi:hypothetical protein